MTTKVNPEPRMLIDGKLVDASGGKTFTNVNPATEEELGQVADASAEDMDRAITAARRAFDETDWSTNRSFRRHCLEQLHQALVAEREEMREQLILEVGCPRMLTAGPQLDAPLDGAITYPARLIDEFVWEDDLADALDFRGNRNSRRIVKEPVGVVGAIVPWNFPFEVSITKVAQALATGNTAILKPAPDTPWNATLLGRIVAEHTDIPPGVLNVVPSSDHMVGEQLTLSPQVDLISFTGSTAVGKRIMEKGAATLKRLFLELGGKSATIVLDDADFGTAMMSGLAVCAHAGQGCAIPTRMLLPRSRYDEGVDLLKPMLGGVPVGDPQRPDILMGPLISEKQRNRVLGYIEKGIERGRHPGPRGWAAGRPGPGLVRGAHPLHRGGQLDDHRPGGDLRSRPGRHPLRGRRRRRADRQRQQLRPERGGRLRLTGPGPGRGQSDTDRQRERERRDDLRSRSPIRGFQGQRGRTAERHRRVRPVPRGEVTGLAGGLTPIHAPSPGPGLDLRPDAG